MWSADHKNKHIYIYIQYDVKNEKRQESMCKKKVCVSISDSTAVCFSIDIEIIVNYVM